MVFEKGGEDKQDQSCEKWRSVTAHRVKELRRGISYRQ